MMLQLRSMRWTNGATVQSKGGSGTELKKLCTQDIMTELIFNIMH